MSIDLDDYVAGGYFLSRLPGQDWADWTGTKLRRVTIAIDHSPRRFFPDSWTLSWTGTSRDERLAAAAVFGIAERDLERVLAWSDGAFDVAYGAWNVIFTLDAARDLARTWLTGSADLELWGLGLHRDLLATYCRATAPPPPEPGYAPMGAGGVHVAACRRKAPLAPGGEVLGFELLVEEMGTSLNSPESLHLDEAAILAKAGVATNANGLIETLEAALACCRLLGAEYPSTPAPGWLPWLLVRYPLQ